MSAPDNGSAESLRACIAAFCEVAIDNARARAAALRALGTADEREVLRVLRAATVDLARASDVLERNVILRAKALDEGKP